jgi:acyl-coenzyme A thioesterase PaaI-like protein
MLAPAASERFVAIGRVVRSGRTITVCTAEVLTEESASPVAMMQATMMAVRDRSGVSD